MKLPLSLILLLMGTAYIRAAPDKGRREKTKEELCNESCLSCMGSLQVLVDIARKTNSQAMGLKVESEMMETKNKILEREIVRLKIQIENPSLPQVDLPPIYSSSVGIPEVNFMYSVCTDCNSLKTCLTTLGHANNYWTSLEEMRTNYQAEIKSLKAKNKKLTKLRDKLKKQLSSLSNNN